MPNIYLLLTPTYKSMGDQAIAYAEILYLKKKYPNYTLKIYSEDETLDSLEKLSTRIVDNDLVFLQGGGNLGDQYPKIEQNRQRLINRLKDIPITIFPQSVFFQDKQSVSQACSVYNDPRITIQAREEFSYALIKDYFPKANAMLKPDIVYSLYDHFPDNDGNRSKIFVSFRRDKESCASDCNKSLSGFLAKQYNNVEAVSMYESGVINHKDREDFVIRSISKFYNAEIVITDRFHGAVFSAITRTPCILLPNSYHKNLGNYKLISSRYNIEYSPTNDPDSIRKLVDKLRERYTTA